MLCCQMAYRFSFERTSIARLFGKQEAGWQRPTSSDSFFNLPRYNTKQRVSPIMSLTLTGGLQTVLKVLPAPSRFGRRKDEVLEP
jgi:hypothetical protein